MLKQVGCLFDHCNLLVYWFFFDKAVGSLVSATTIAAALGVIIPIVSMSVLLTDCNETRYLSTHHKLFEVQHKNMDSCRWNFAYLHSTRRYWSGQSSRLIAMKPGTGGLTICWLRCDIKTFTHAVGFPCAYIAQGAVMGVKNRNVMWKFWTSLCLGENVEWRNKLMIW